MFSLGKGRCRLQQQAEWRLPWKQRAAGSAVVRSPASESLQGASSFLPMGMTRRKSSIKQCVAVVCSGGSCCFACVVTLKRAKATGRTDAYFSNLSYISNCKLNDLA